MVIHRDLAYAAPVGRGHLLDLYVPEDAAGPFPVVVVQLGSAFRSDDTKSGAPRTPRDGRPPVPGAAGDPVRHVAGPPAEAPTGLGGSVTGVELA